MNTRGNHHQHSVLLVTRTATVMALIASLLVWGATTAPEAAAAESAVEVTTVNASPTELAVPVISDDAAEVAYAQPSSEDHEIAVKNLATGTVEVLETTGGYRPGYTGIQALAADTDASVVAYQANDTDLDDYGARIGVFDRDTDSVEPVDYTVSNQPSYDDVDTVMDISDDGRYIAFAGEGGVYSSAVTEPWFDQDMDVFVRDRDTDTTESITAQADTIGDSRDSFQPSMSGDAAWVAFTSERDFDGIETSDTYPDLDVFVVSRSGGTPVRISVSDTGTQLKRGTVGARSSEPYISDDGRFVVFTSNATNLSTADIWDKWSGISQKQHRSRVYVHDRDTDDDGIFDEPDKTSTKVVASSKTSGSWPSITADGLTVQYHERTGGTGTKSLLVSTKRTSTASPFREAGVGQADSAANKRGHDIAEDDGTLAFARQTNANPTETTFYAVNTGNARYHRSFWELTAFREPFPTVSDPVSTATGALMVQQTDLVSPGGVWGLDWARTYNSYTLSTGALGAGWQHSFGMVLAQDPDSGDVELIDDEGRLVPFESTGAGTWAEPGDFDGTLAERGDGSFAVEFHNGQTWEFDTDGLLEQLTNWDGQHVDIVRNPDSTIASVTSSTDASLTFSYVSGRLGSVASSDGRSVTYTYDDNDNLYQVTGVDGAVHTYNCDELGRIVSEVDAAGVTIHTTTYGLDGRVATQTLPSGSVTTFTYNDTARTTAVHDSLTNTTVTYSQDSAGRVDQIEDPFTEIADHTYDTDGNLTGFTSRLGGVHTQSFDAAGNLLSAQTPTGDYSYSYDSDNRVTSATAPATGTTTYGYTGAERIPTSITDTLGRTTTQTVSSGLVTSTTDPDGVMVLYRYNTARLLVESEDAYGNVTGYEYDAVGRPSATTLPSGARTETTYDAKGRVIKVKAADGGETLTAYDSAGRVDTVTDPAGAVTDYNYDPVTGLLDTMTDPMLRVTDYDYDTAGQLVKTTFADGSFTASDYGTLGRVEATRDELGRETTFGYDADGNVTETTDPAGGVIATEYDTAGRVTKTVDPALRETTTDYDPITGQVVSETSPLGTVTYTYDALGRQSTLTDVRGGVTTTTYTDGGRTDTVTDPAGLVTDYDYDLAGRQATVTAPGGLVTTYGYDIDSRVASVTSPEGLVTATTYDPVGRVASVTDPAGVVTTTDYTPRGEVHTTGRSGEGTVEYEYYPDGNVEWVDDALDKRTSFTYDNRGRPEKRIDPELNEWVTDYNPAGELVSETDPLLRTTTYGYDNAGRLETTADPSGRTTTNVWQLDGLLDSWTATDGTNTQTGDHVYDPATGLRTSTTVDGDTWDYAYYDSGDPKSVISPDGAEISYSWDPAGRRETVTGIDGLTQRYVYDAAGDVDAIRTRQYMADRFVGADGTEPDPVKWDLTGAAAPTIENQEASFAVTDAVGSKGRMNSLGSLAGGYDTTYTLDLGDRTKATKVKAYNRYVTPDSWDVLEFTSNSTTATLKRKAVWWELPLGTTDVPATGDVRVRMHSGQQWLHLKVWAAADPEPETWDIATQSVTPSWWGKPEWQVEGGKANTANTVTVDDVSIARLNGAESNLATYEHNDDHQVTTENLPMGATRTWGYQQGRVATMTQTGAGLDSTSSVGYDTSGRISQETVNGNTTGYGYDQAGQLTAITPTGGPAESFTYTDLGQRHQHTTNAGTTNYNYNNAAELTSTTGATNTTYTHDPAGRRLTETTGTDTTAYHYDPAGRHIGITDPTATTLRALDPAGNPEQVITTPASGPTETSRLQWDTTQANPQLAAIQNPSGTTNTLIRADETNAWSTVTTGPTTRPLAADIHQSTTAKGPAGSLATSTSYNAFGEPTATPAHQPTLGYRSETTIETLTHLRARQYDPTTATFTTTDPLLGINGTTTLNNPYHYTNNNPLNHTDPTGLAPDDSDIRCPNRALGDTPLTDAGYGIISTYPVGCDASASVAWSFMARGLDDFMRPPRPVCFKGFCANGLSLAKFFAFSRTGGPFDPKPILRDYLRGPGAPFGGSEVVDLGHPEYLYYYDVLGNAIWGVLATNYVLGTNGSIEALLRNCPIQSLCGDWDAGDDVAVRAGLRVGRQSGQNATLNQLLRQLRSATSEFRAVGSFPYNIENAPKNKLVRRSEFD